MSSRNYAPAIERLRRSSASPHTERALAEALFRSTFDLRQDPAAAIERLNEAISLDPYRPEFQYHRGLAWQRGGRFDRAIADFERVLKLESKNVRVQHQLALALLDAGRIEDARKRWSEAEGAVKAGNLSPAERDRALFKLACGRVLAALHKNGADNAVEELAKLKPPAGAEALAGEMVIRLLAAGCGVEPLARWIGALPDNAKRKAALEKLGPWLRFKSQPAKERIAATAAPNGTPPAAARVRALLAYDAARETGDPGALARPGIRSQDEWRGMAHLAALHAKAEQAYAAEQWDVAFEFWSAALNLAPCDPLILQNLALTATRAHHLVGFQRYWEWLERVWYTNSTVAPEVRSWSIAAAEKHLTFGAKRLEEVRKSKPESPVPDALWSWIDEMERYFLVEAFGFESDLHLLGIQRHTPQYVVESAYEALKAKVQRYGGLALPAQQQEFEGRRRKRLEEAWKNVGETTARRGYHSPQQDEEAPRAKAVLERRLAYLIEAADFAKERAADLAKLDPEQYRTFCLSVLEHPWPLLQRALQDAKKIDSLTAARGWIGDLLSPYYPDRITRAAEAARSNAARSEWKSACALLEELRLVAPCRWDQVYRWGLAERTLGNPGESLPLLRRAREECDRSERYPTLDKQIRETEKNREHIVAAPFQNAAIEAMNAQQWEEALKWLEKTVQRCPDIAAIKVYAAQCEMQLKKLDGAAARLDNLALPEDEALREQVAQLRQSLAVSHMNAREWDKAVAQLDKALAIDPKDAGSWVLRSNSVYARVVQAINEKKLQPTATSMSEARDNVERARKCPNAKEHKRRIKPLRKQIRAAEKRLK